MIVGIIWNAKFKDQVEIGDQVMAIDGVSCENTDPCKFLTDDTVGKESVVLTVKNKMGEIKEVIITKE